MFSEQSCQNCGQHPKYSHITPVRKALHWLPIKYRSIFKTAVVAYKFLRRGNPKYFEPFLIPRYSAYNTCLNQTDGMFLEDFGLSCAYDAPVLHMTISCDLERPPCKFTCLFQVKAEVLPLWKSISTLISHSFPSLSMALTPAMSLAYEY